MTYFTVSIPTIDSDVRQFSFSTNILSTAWQFTFRWMDTYWALFVDVPDGTRRPAGVKPNAPSWTGYGDYTVEFVTDKPEIGLTTLPDCELVVGIA